MRPKIVILTLVVAFGLLGLIAVLKGVGGKNGDQAKESALNAPATPATLSPATDAPVAAVGSGAINSGAVSPEIRAAIIQKELEEIQALRDEVDGTNNAIVISALLDKMKALEPEVRKAALDALVQMNDTNAVPGLQTVADNTKEPHEKVSIMNAIEYLKLPDILANTSPDDVTNFNAINNSNLLARFPNIATNRHVRAGGSLRAAQQNNARPAPQPQ